MKIRILFFIPYFPSSCPYFLDPGIEAAAFLTPSLTNLSFQCRKSHQSACDNCLNFTVTMVMLCSSACSLFMLLCWYKSYSSQEPHRPCQEKLLKFDLSLLSRSIKYDMSFILFFCFPFRVCHWTVQKSPSLKYLNVDRLMSLCPGQGVQRV